MVAETSVASAGSTGTETTAPMAAVVLYNPVMSIHSGCVAVTRCYADQNALNADTLSSYMPVNAVEEISTPRSVAVETAEPAIVFYPNPTTGQFNISGLPAGTKIEIFDITGKLIYQSVSTNGQESVDITNEAKGLYFYRITGANVGLQSGKIVKE